MTISMKTAVHIVPWGDTTGVVRYCEGVGRALKGRYCNVLFITTSRRNASYVARLSSIFDVINFGRPSLVDIVNLKPSVCIWHCGNSNILGFCNPPKSIRNIVFMHGQPPPIDSCFFNHSRDDNSLQFVFPSAKRREEHRRTDRFQHVVHSPVEVSRMYRVRIGNHNCGNGDSRKFNSKTPDFVSKILSDFPSVEFHYMGMYSKTRHRFPKISRLYIYPVDTMPVPAFLRLIDIFFSWMSEKFEEGFSLAIGEAMAAGLPVVVDDKGGTPEIVENGVQGFLCKTEKDFRTALEKLISDPLLRRSMGASGIKTAEERLSLDGVFRKTIIDLVEN